MTNTVEQHEFWGVFNDKDELSGSFAKNKESLLAGIKNYNDKLAAGQEKLSLNNVVALRVVDSDKLGVTRQLKIEDKFYQEMKNISDIESNFGSATKLANENSLLKKYLFDPRIDKEESLKRWNIFERVFAGNLEGVSVIKETFIIPFNDTVVFAFKKVGNRLTEPTLTERENANLDESIIYNLTEEEYEQVKKEFDILKNITPEKNF